MKKLNTQLRVLTTVLLLTVSLCLSGCAAIKETGQGFRQIFSGQLNPLRSQNVSEVPMKNGFVAKTSQNTPGADVLKAQQILTELGYDLGKPDGIVGNKTRAAVENFQKDNGFNVDGLVSSVLLQFRSEILAQN